MVDKGLASFIKRKYESHASPAQIRGSLRKAGFSDKEIDEGFKKSKALYKDTHQDIVAANSFLPPLKKKTKATENNEPIKKHQSKGEHISFGGSFFQGRLHRVDFILGILFFIGLGIVFISIIMTFLSELSPEAYRAVLSYTLHNPLHGWVILVPIVFLPLTFVVLSLSARRLHDIGLPGALSFVLLSYFIPLDTELFSMIEIAALYLVASLIFLIMLAKPGVSDKNKYGSYPKLEGSFFERII